MINLDQKYFGLKLFTWIILIVTLIYLIFCKSCKESFASSDPNVLKVYNFNTTWCGYSVRFQPIWDEFHKKMRSNKNVQTLDIKCDNQDDPRVRELCQKFGGKGFPTVIFNKGDQVVQYDEERTVKKLESKTISMLSK